MYLFMLLPAAYIITFAYVPMAGLRIAFQEFDITAGMNGSPWVGLYYFKHFLKAYQFKNVLYNTLSIQLYGLCAGFPFPILFAIALNSVRSVRYRKFVQTVTYMPYFISMVVMVSMLIQVFNPLTGIYGAISRALFGATPMDLFGSTSAYPHLYVWSGVWKNFGYDSIIYIAALTAVSPSLHEAAMIDGANRFQRVLHVDIPTIMPTVVIMLILSAGRIMSMGFEKSYLMQNSLNLSKSEVIATFIYKKGLGSGSSNDYSYATAIGMFNSLVNTIMIVLVNTIARRIGETSLW